MNAVARSRGEQRGHGERSRRPRPLLLAFAVAFALVVWSAISALAVRRELAQAESVLADSLADLQPADVMRARAALLRVQARLEAFPLDLAHLLPVARQNMDAVAAAVTGTIPVLDTAADLRRALDRVGREDLVVDGKVRLDVVPGLAAPLERAEVSLGRLEKRLADGLTGWLVPPLWDELDERRRAVKALRKDAAAAASALEVARNLFGAGGRRRYLVIFVNPAEARGAGGIVSGVGSVSVVDGRVRLGRFRHAGDISPRPYRRVHAPRDLRRRFGRYGSNSTLLANISMSPDVPEVTRTVSRAFRSLTGAATDGALVVDARGVASLMPDASEVEVRGTGKRLGREELPEYVYSGAYDDLGPARRHDALIDAGKVAFEAALRAGEQSMGWLRGVAEAARGGHLRFVSFHPAERKALAGAAVDGALRPPPGDAVFVTTQNLGGDKLDYWIRRSLRHSCRISRDAAACQSEITLFNDAPRRLPRYVTQGKPDARLETFLEVYIPQRARTTSVLLDGAPIGFASDTEDGYLAIGVVLELSRRREATVQIGYTLPLGGERYSLRLWPQQPLAHASSLRVQLSAPPGWRLYGPEGSSSGRAVFKGALEEPLAFSAEGLDRGGIPAAWDAVVRFWQEPVFALGAALSGAAP